MKKTGQELRKASDESSVLRCWIQDFTWSTSCEVTLSGFLLLHKIGESAEESDLGTSASLGPGGLIVSDRLHRVRTSGL